MVVKITSPHSLQRALNYNEQKVQKGKAECIDAVNYILPPAKMNFYEKMERMQYLISLNERSKKSNTLHISLNFDPTEKLGREKLTSIAHAYMEKIGFAQQPYLVYQHFDAGHPHLHIVTTTIQADGKRIDTYNIGRNQSEKARKEIENVFCLVRAQERKLGLHSSPVPPVQKAQYGKSETRRTIANVLDKVIGQFKFTSLPELNAVLGEYNIMADRGQEDRVIFRKGGLLYRMLDEKGNKIGMPIKASLFHNKPTLKYLETKFSLNETLRQADKKRLKTAVDWVLAKQLPNLEAFSRNLLKENVRVVFRRNQEKLVYGITFIDYRTKSVFNGSDLGKQYSVAGIQNRLSGKSNGLDQTNESRSLTQSPTQAYKESKHTELNPEQPKAPELLQELTGYEKTFDRLPPQLLKKKKKKRNF